MISIEEASRFANGFDDPARLSSAFAGVAGDVGTNAVSYTHLDVYKRQVFVYLFTFIIIDYQHIIIDDRPYPSGKKCLF